MGAMKWLRRWNLPTYALYMAVGMGAVMVGTNTVANQFNLANDKSRQNKLEALHREEVPAFYAMDDEPGALANWKKIAPNAMPDPAADVGALGAAVALAAVRFDELEPHHFNLGMTPQETTANEQGWRPGLERFEGATQSSCFVAYPQLLASPREQCPIPQRAAGFDLAAFGNGHADLANRILRERRGDKAMTCEPTAGDPKGARVCQIFSRGGD